MLKIYFQAKFADLKQLQKKCQAEQRERNVVSETDPSSKICLTSDGQC